MATKQTIKGAARKAATSKPAAKAIPVFNIKPVHALIRKDFAAMLAEGKAGLSCYQAFKAVILAAPLNDAKGMAAVLSDMRDTFGDAYADKYAIRATLLNNARKVECGGTKNKHVIPGRGRAVLIAALDSVTSIRELREALAEAKPAGLKEAKAKTGPKAAPKKAKAAPAPVNAVSLPTDKLGAFEAACKVLALCETFLSPGSDSATINAIESAIKALQGAELKVRLQDKAKETKAA